MAPNAVLNDKNLSLKAKGLYIYLFSKPDGWEFHIDIMQSELKESKGQIYSVLKELIRAGYIVRNQMNENGRFGGIVYEFLNPCCEKPHADKPCAEKPAYGSACTHNNIYNISNTDIRNNMYNNNNVLFEDFWREYTPVENKEGHFVAKGSKQKTREKYLKLLKEGIENEKIINGMRQYLNYCQRNGVQSCSAEVFINQRRFDNDYECAERLQSRTSRAGGYKRDGFIEAASQFINDPNIPDYGKLY